MGEVLTATAVTKRFPASRRLLQPVPPHVAVDQVDVEVDRGETVGVVGESGAGKSTLGRLLLALIRPDAGHIRFGELDLTTVDGRALRRLRARMQMIFQDPYSTLDPRMTIGDLVAEPFVVHQTTPRAELQQRAEELLVRVGLNARHVDRYPHEFSGGQLQRVGVARAIATKPDLVVCDEPVAALDSSMRAQIVNLLQDLQLQDRMSYVFISHDLSLVQAVAGRTYVMYGGSVVETGPSALLFKDPLHPYTEDLVRAIPRVGMGKRPLGEPRQRRPADEANATGCRYAYRCPLAEERCRHERPLLTPRPGGRAVACHVR